MSELTSSKSKQVALSRFSPPGYAVAAVASHYTEQRRRGWQKLHAVWSRFMKHQIGQAGL